MSPKIKAKLAGMSKKEKIAFLRQLKRRKKREAEDPESLAESHKVLENLFGDPPSNSQLKKKIKGISLFDVWRALQEVREVLSDVQRLSQELHTAGAGRLLPEGRGGVTADIGLIDPVKLYDFVHAIPGLWDTWGCSTAQCIACPYHHGKGVDAQNRECASEAIKVCQRHNKRTELYKGIPYEREELEKMHRRELVSLCSILKVNALTMKDSSKEGIIKTLTPAFQRKHFKKDPAMEQGLVEIPNLLLEGPK